MMRMSVPFSNRWVAKLWRRVWTVTRVHACHLAGYLAGDLQGLGIDGALSIAPWKQPDFWMRQSPISPQDIQKPRRQHDVAVLAALAVLYSDDSPAAVDIPDLQARRFRRPQTRGISCG